MKILLTFIAAILICGSALSETFVNWNAEYKVTYPDDWHHVPYSTANIFLKIQGIEPKDFLYEGVLAKKSEKPFYEEPYLFMLSDKIGKLSAARVDSLLASVEEEYNYKIKKAEITGDNVVLGIGQPVYDAKNSFIVVKNRITSEFADKYMLEIRKIYDGGIAYFLCYAPKEQYNEAQPMFFDIVRSFTTENLEEAAQKTDGKIVDIENRELEKYDESEFESEDSGSSNLIYILIGAILVLAVVFIVARKR